MKKSMSMQIGGTTLELVLGDITEQTVDVIVNAANAHLAGGGGVDGAIHRKAGTSLIEETRQKYPNGCPTSSAVVTGAGNLSAKFVFHAVGPRWNGGTGGEAEHLRSAYRKCLELAVENRCESIAFPSISTGAYGYPINQAAEIALQTVKDFCGERPDSGMTLVRFVLFSGGDFQVYAGVLDRLIPSEQEYSGKAKPNTLKNIRMSWANVDKKLIKEISQAVPDPDEAKILAYLEEGEIFGTIKETVDVIDNQPLNGLIYTDGVYVWDDPMIDYIRKHHIKVGESFKAQGALIFCRFFIDALFLR